MLSRREHFLSQKVKSQKLKLKQLRLVEMLTSLNQSFFETPESLPLLNITALVGKKSTSQTALIVAPHPDDETLGCGGAIALLRQLNLNVKVLIVSDGTKSHPNSLTYPAPRLKKLREQESLAALKILGVTAESVTFWGIPDGAVNASIQSPQTIFLTKEYLKQLQPSLIFLPWRKDPHRDHRASWQLLSTTSQSLANPPRILEYPIWDWDVKQRGEITGIVECWRINISQVLELKKKAIALYCSQISDLINDDPQGFRLTGKMLQNFIQPWEIYLEVIMMNKPKDSLQPSYFDSLYQANIDPWDFETSDYEAQKYQTTIAALPKPRYTNALEIGGSIGVLTAKLATRCESLLSIDVSSVAQQKAIARCQNLPHVRFKIAQVPQVYPAEMFDLTLVSEVGYYLSWNDLEKTRQLIIDHLVVGGHLLLVHWTLFAKDYPLTGDEVHEYFWQLNGTKLKHLQGLRQERYRLDLFERI